MIPAQAVRQFSQATLLCLFVALSACRADTSRPDIPEPPDWTLDAIWYQIFPERFRNGDPTNDPGRESLARPDRAPDNWRISDWGADWYARAPWERRMGRSFYDSVFHRRYGGDLQGVIDKLDYLKSLGVNAIYFNPLFYANSLHKYDGNSFHHIDPYFGPDPAGDLAHISMETEDPATWQWTSADRLFIDLLRQAHDMDLRVIIDGVWNHTGRDFFAFRDILERQEESRYKDWFNIIAFDDPSTKTDEFDYHGWWGHKSLPEFVDTPDGSNLAEGPMRYIFDATRRWMDPDGDGDPSDGVDGWRLDVAEEVPALFWREWHKHVRAINPDAYTSAEIWTSARDFLADRHFNACMNYAGCAIPVKGWLVDDGIPVSVFARLVNEQRESYGMPGALAMQNLVDSHDTQRIASAIANRPRRNFRYEDTYCNYDSEYTGPRANKDYNISAPDENGRRIQEMVALFQATYVGAPMIYYGTESGMWGADDPDDRKPMLWEDIAYQSAHKHPSGRNTERDAVAFAPETFAAYQTAFRLRKYSRALRRGDYRELLADDSRNCFAFSRTLDDETVVVLFNRSTAEKTLELDAGLPETPARNTARLIHATGHAAPSVSVKSGNDTLTVRLPGLTAVVLAL